jgi:hypothetical protein
LRLTCHWFVNERRLEHRQVLRNVNRQEALAEAGACSFNDSQGSSVMRAVGRVLSDKPE